MPTKQTTFGLSGNQLKIFALLAMTLDHIGLMFLPNVMIIRVIGRMSMPIFAWMISEGCRYTKKRAQYFGLIFGMGLICQIVYFMFMQSLYQCVLITFSLSILIIYLLDYAKSQKNVLSFCLLGIVLVGVCYVCVFLPQDLPGTDFSIDYNIFGVMLPVVIYMGKTKEQKLIAAAGVLAMLAIWNTFIQWYALFALPLLALYNGQRGKLKLKYLFYVYYPLHLAALYGIGLLLR